MLYSVKMRVILFCTILTIVSARLRGNAVNETEETGRIINGREAALGDFPWQVGIFHTIGNKDEFCGGALITNQWILTAGHCVYGANNFEVILGATRAYDQQPTKIVLGVMKAIYHPNYNKPAKLNNDVALLKLQQPVQFNQYIQPITLAPANYYLPPNQEVVISGWGKTSDQQNQIVNNLNFVYLRTISNQDCKRYFIAELVPDTVVCCDGSQFLSTCSGDSGGPLIQKINNVWYHVGVVSFVSLEGCAKGRPSGFARTSSFLDFIIRNVD